MTYDKFTPWESVKKVKNSFQASRYEVWMAGTMIDNGLCETEINFIPAFKADGQETMSVVVKQNARSVDIDNIFKLDVSVTQDERIMHVTIPYANENECVGLKAMRGYIGITDAQAKIRHNTPFCSSQFFKCRLPVKVTFSLSDPDKLIEFYSERDEDNALTLIAARCGLELLIDDYDSDGAYVGIDVIKNLAQEQFGVDIQDKHLKKAESMLNASSNMVSIGNTGMPYHTSFLKSNTNRGPMQQTFTALKQLTGW